jgi:transposase
MISRSSNSFQPQGEAGGSGGGVRCGPSLGPPSVSPWTRTETDRARGSQTLREKGKKNDPADAVALCEAASRPDMMFVPVKSIEQQGILALHSARSLLVKQQTMLANAMHRVADRGDRRQRPVQSARHFAARLGPVPRQYSTGGKTRLGRITESGSRSH